MKSNPKAGLPIGKWRLKVRNRRASLSLKRWSLEDRALFLAVWIVFADANSLEIYEKISTHRPDIGEEYRKRTQRLLTASVIYHRIDKAIRNLEMVLFRAFIYPAIKEVESWT